MRHAVFGRRLSRDTNARRALLKNLASDLLIKGALTTTQAKAKFARGYVEKLVTASKDTNLSTQRKLASTLTHQAFTRLVGEIGPGFANRAGGYTRIIKLGQRSGDGAPLARLEFLKWEKPQTAPRAKTTQPMADSPRRKSASKSAKSAKSKL